MGAKEPTSDGRRTDGETTVMAAIDRSGGAARLVIADVTRDDTWLSIPASEAPTLAEWR